MRITKVIFAPKSWPPVVLPTVEFMVNTDNRLLAASVATEKMQLNKRFSYYQEPVAVDVEIMDVQSVKGDL